MFIFRLHLQRSPKAALNSKLKFSTVKQTAGLSLGIAGGLFSKQQDSKDPKHSVPFYPADCLPSGCCSLRINRWANLGASAPLGGVLSSLKHHEFSLLWPQALSTPAILPSYFCPLLSARAAQTRKEFLGRETFCLIRACGECLHTRILSRHSHGPGWVVIWKVLCCVGWMCHQVLPSPCALSRHQRTCFCCHPVH